MMIPAKDEQKSPKTIHWDNTNHFGVSQGWSESLEGHHDELEVDSRPSQNETNLPTIHFSGAMLC